MGNILLLLAESAHGATAEHAGPAVWGLGPVFWVSLAMLILIGIMGVEEGMLRINVGLEDPLDLIDDLDQALTAIGL